jgi:putative ABC transport system permease protein
MRWDRWSYDVRYALRRLARRPAFALVVVATLGLGVGANTAVFSVLHSVLLAPLPYEEDEQLVRIYGNRRDVPEGNLRNYLAAPAALELRDDAASLAAVAVLENYSPEGVDLTGGDRPERVRLLRVNADYFSVLRVAPVAGRVFRRTEETAASHVAVVREDLWRRYLGGRPGAVGGSLTLDGEAVTVVGVVSDAVRDPLEGRIDVWMPTDLLGDRSANWDDNYLSSFARLQPGATVAALRSELDVLADRHAEISADAAEKGYTVLPLREDLVGAAEPLLTAIMGAVLFLLLLTCVNVTSLLLARAAARERELAIRTSLGAARSSLARHFLIETCILSLAGGLAGVAIGLGALDLIMSVAPAGLPRREGVTLGPEAVVFAASASVVIGIVLGLATSLPFTRPKLDSVVSGSRSSGTSSGRPRVRSALVAVEVALAVVLLTGAGVLLRTVQELRNRELGADPSGVLTFSVGLPATRYGSDEAIYRFSEAFHERARAIPGVLSAAVTSRLPVTGTYNTWGTRRAHAVNEPFDTENIQVNQRWIAGDYFRTAGLELVSGRFFTAADEADAPYKVVVNQTLVRRLFADEDPRGQLLRIGGRYTEIIGVVEDEALTARSAPAPIAFHHQRQWIGGNREITQMVRVSGEPPAYVPALRDALAEVDPQLVLFEPVPLEDVIRSDTAQERFAASLLAVFAALAAFLAGLGLHGVLSHHVGRQRHEIGVRIALGAELRGVVGMVVGRGLRLTAIGALAGLLLALSTSAALESLLYEVSARDPLVLSAAPLLLLVVAGVSSYLPAVRATRVDPVESFRAE